MQVDPAGPRGLCRTGDGRGKPSPGPAGSRIACADFIRHNSRHHVVGKWSEVGTHAKAQLQTRLSRQRDQRVADVGYVDAAGTVFEAFEEPLIYGRDTVNKILVSRYRHDQDRQRLNLFGELAEDGGT